MTDNEFRLEFFAHDFSNLIDETAKTTLELITKLEIGELRDLDPSFEQRAKEIKTLLIAVSELSEDAEFQSKVLGKLQEYLGVLESIATSLTEWNNQLLIDCIAHLQEFVDIGNNGNKEEAQHEK